MGYLLLLVCLGTPNETHFKQLQQKAQIPRSLAGEVSGIVASRTYPGVIWLHNDSGSGAALIAIDENGKHLATYVLKGAKSRDWEDIAQGANPFGEGNFLYVADVGNNKAHSGKPHKNVRIYRFPEPNPHQQGARIKTYDFSPIYLTYPDSAHDVEAVTIDPQDGALYLFTKREPRSRVYRLDNPHKAKGEHVLTFVGEIPFTMLVAADINADGSRILLKDYASVWFWQRDSQQPLFELLQTPGHRVSAYLIEPQGESVSFDARGRGFFTISEARKQKQTPLYYYPAAP